MPPKNYNGYISFREALVLTKMGRPKAEEPKKNKVGIRLSDREMECLKAYAIAHRTTVTKVLRDSLEEKTNLSELVRNGKTVSD